MQWLRICLDLVHIKALINNKGMKYNMKLEMIDKEEFTGDYESTILEQWYIRKA